ncbi:MAG: lysylphosphatidylglycerol synthase transmembrane domain-containing protein, partial [Ktedonobacterales bacterium]
MAHALQRILRPNVLIPVFLVVAAVVLLFSFGNPARILAEMKSFNRVDLIWVFLLMVVYESIRFVQWWYLLRHEGVRVSLKAQIFSFAGGEATRFMPIGNYFENYLLTAAEGVDFGFSSAVTTMVILLEVAVSLTGLVVLGLGGWWWVRPLIVIGVILAAAAAWLFYHFHHSLDAPAWVCRSTRARKAWESITGELRQFARGVKKILHWRTLLISYLLAAAYLVTAGGILYVILAGIGWGSTPFGEVLAVYFFSLAFGLIFPLPVDIGVTELSGVGAFLVVGVERNTAISAMLINRVLTLGFSIVIGIVVCVLFRDEFRRALHSRGARRAGQPDSAESDTAAAPSSTTSAGPSPQPAPM